MITEQRIRISIPIWGRLPSLQNGMMLSDFCNIFGSVMEDRLHAICDCKVANHIWADLGAQVRDINFFD